MDEIEDQREQALVLEDLLEQRGWNVTVFRGVPSEQPVSVSIFDPTKENHLLGFLEAFGDGWRIRYAGSQESGDSRRRFPDAFAAAMAFQEALEAGHVRAWHTLEPVTLDSRTLMARLLR